MHGWLERSESLRGYEVPPLVQTLYKVNHMLSAQKVRWHLILEKQILAFDVHEFVIEVELVDSLPELFECLLLDSEEVLLLKNLNTFALVDEVLFEFIFID